jgi:hypothetical protein
MFIPLARATGLAFLIVTLAGCGESSGRPSLVPVSGTVSLDDKPLSGAVVTFIPAGSTPGGMVTARTGQDGQYTLKSRNGSGAPPGEYRVVISKRKMPDGSDVPADDPTPPIQSPARETLPLYSDQNNPTLGATVPPDGGTIHFPLKSQPVPR